jgi:hypothetical protein
MNAVSTVSQEMARTRPQRMPLEPKAPGPEPTPQRLAMENLAYYGGPSVSHQKELSDTEPIRKRRVEQVIAPEYFTTRRERRANREATLGIIMAPQMHPGVSVPIAPPQTMGSMPAPRPARAPAVVPPPPIPQTNSRQRSAAAITAAPEPGVPANDVRSRRQQLMERIALATKPPASQIRQTGPGSVAVIPRPSVKQEVRVGTPNPARPTIVVAPPSERPLLQTEAPIHAAQARTIRERTRRTTAMKAAQIDEPDAPTDAQSQFSFELPVSVRARSRRVQPGGIKTPAQIASAVAAAPIVPKPPAPKEPESDILRTLLEQNKLMAEQNRMMNEQVSLLQSQIKEMQVASAHQSKPAPEAVPPQMMWLGPSKGLDEEVERSSEEFREFMRSKQAKSPSTPPPTPDKGNTTTEALGEEEKQADDAEFEDAMMETASLVVGQVLDVVDGKAVEKEEAVAAPAAVVVVPDLEPATKPSARSRRKKT